MDYRFDGSESVVIVAAQKRTLGGRELQLPCMSSLTSKTSTQKFFLRVLQVIIQLREDTRRANKKAKQTGGRLSKSLSFNTEASSNPLRTFPRFTLKLSIESSPIELYRQLILCSRVYLDSFSICFQVPPVWARPAVSRLRSVS